jgi:hypothetical protein
LRLLDLKFLLVDFFHEGQNQPEHRRSLVAIGRADYRVNVKEVEAWQFAFLRECESPVSAHVAARRAAEESGTEPSFVLAHLVIWLPIAIQSGFLRVDDQTH